MHRDQIIESNRALGSFLRPARSRTRQQQQTKQSTSQSMPMHSRSHALSSTAGGNCHLSSRCLRPTSMQHSALAKLPVVSNCARVTLVRCSELSLTPKLLLFDRWRVPFGNLAQHIHCAGCHKMRIALAAMIIHRQNSVVVIVL